MVQPRTINLDGIFGILNNVVWTSRGPCAVDGLRATRMRLRQTATSPFIGVDKFPRMVDYVDPDGRPNR